MQVGYKARVVSLERQTENDRSAYVERDGLLVRRLNVAWEPGLGALWQLRFDDGTEEIFAESELNAIRADGRLDAPVTDTLGDTWGIAPRVRSYPFTKFGQGQRAAPRVLGVLLFIVSGALLAVSGIASGSLAVTLGGVALAGLGILAALILAS